MSFVQGEKDIEFLEKRVKKLTAHPLFHTMKFSKDPEVLKEWIPLMMKDRAADDKVAATRMVEGADVNFGNLTRHLIGYLKTMDGVTLMSGWETTDIDRPRKSKIWNVEAKNRKSGAKKVIDAKFIFIGAGGKALTLLEKSGIPEGKGYGGFPVSGQWLRCNNRKIIDQHDAKVYGKAAEGAPPMSVPHLDTRSIRGKRELLFGPFAGFSTKFLKHGSYFDLPASLRLTNLVPMIRAGLDNLSLTKYLIEQVRLHPEERLASLKEFYPDAQLNDWDLAIAGQRVQIIKKDKKEGGVLAFGTEVVHSKDGSLAALLGASPGASTAVSIILNVLDACFKDWMKDPKVNEKIKEIIPSYGHSLIKDGEMAMKIRKASHEVLHLEIGV
jgi:malate dehydrogenase (quinone)